MLVRDRRTSSANGAFGRHERRYLVAIRMIWTAFADHVGRALLAFGASGHQLIPLNSTSINRVFGYFLRKASRASLRPAENPPSSASGSSLKNEAISPPLSSKMRTDIRTSDPLLPMKIPNALPVSIQQLVTEGVVNGSINSN
jgi:hypothetical protein